MLVPENQSPTVAVLLPCYNEEVTIGKIVRDFKASLPQADIYVYDNNSTDRTADIAASEGAIVRKEPRQGKGNVIRAMFEDIDADVYAWQMAMTPIRQTRRLPWWIRCSKATIW